VMATQNPLEQDGIYPLPEGQLDRFLMQIVLGYPDLASERSMLLATTGVRQPLVEPVFDAAGLLAAQALVRAVPVGETVVGAILTLVRSGRPETTTLPQVRRHVAWGPGPRASQALMLACRARALLHGRFIPSLEDVQDLAGPVLRHRMALTFAARAEGIDLDDIIDALCGTVDA